MKDNRYFLNQTEVDVGIVSSITICEINQPKMKEIQKPKDEIIEHLMDGFCKYSYPKWERITEEHTETPTDAEFEALKFLTVSLKRNNLIVPDELNNELKDKDKSKALAWEDVKTKHKFKLFDKVIFEGVEYRCIQEYQHNDVTHTPDKIPAIWEVL